MKKLFLLLCLALSGCTSTSQLYYWGQYEDIIYTSFVNAGELTAQQQIDMLTQDIQYALDNNMRPAPGMYAQLGTAAVENGQKKKAKDAFLREAELHPDSKPFMDYLVRQLDKELDKEKKK